MLRGHFVTDPTPSARPTSRSKRSEEAAAACVQRSLPSHAGRRRAPQQQAMPYDFQYNMQHGGGVRNMRLRDSKFYTPSQFGQPIRPNGELMAMPPLPTCLMERPLSGIDLPRASRPLSSGEWGYKSSLHVRKTFARRSDHGRIPFSARSPSQVVAEGLGNQPLPPIAATD